MAYAPEGKLDLDRLAQESTRSKLALRFAWLAVTIGAVAYGSLLPFQFDLSLLARPQWWTGIQLGFRSTNIDDVLINLFVYLPIGAAAAVLVRSRLERLLTVMGVAFFVSALLELIQLGLPQRVTSILDVALNVIGALIGGLMFFPIRRIGGLALSRARYAYTRNSPSTLASLLTLALFTYSLVPFDFVASSDALYDSFRRATILDNLGSSSDRMGSIFPVLAEHFTLAIWMGVLGFLGVLGWCRQGVGPGAARDRAVSYGFVLAALIETMQLFTHSHQFELIDILIRSFGVMVGARVAMWQLSRESPGTPESPTRYSVHPVVQVSLVVLQIGVIILSAWPSSGLSATPSHAMSVWPFLILWRASTAGAAASMLSGMVTYAALAATLALTLGRKPRRNRWIGIGAATLTVALVAGIMRSLLAGVPFDPTPLTFAVLAVFAVRWAFSQVEVRRLDEIPQRAIPMDRNAARIGR